MLFAHKESCALDFGPECLCMAQHCFNLITGPLAIFWHYALFPILELMLDFSLICTIWPSCQQFYLLTKEKKNWTQDTEDE